MAPRDASPTGDRPIRVGLVGAGNVSVNAHIPAYLAQPETFRVVALADPTEARLELGRTLLGLPRGDTYADSHELLARDDLDMIDVCTPQHLRRDIVIAACERGHHVLSEKPLAIVPRDAAAMVEAAGRRGVTLGIVHNYLLFPEVRRTLDVIRSGEIGSVEVVLLNWLGVVDAPGAAAYRPTWRHDPTVAGGGVLMDMLHIVYLGEALLGARIQRASAWMHARAEGAPVEDLAICRFEADGAVALANVGWGVGPGGFAVSGSDGRIEVTYKGGASGAFAPFERLVVHGRHGIRRSRKLEPNDSIARVIADFGEALRTGRPPIAPGEQGQHILEATLAAYASAATGETISLPLPVGSPVFEQGLAGLSRPQVPAWTTVRQERVARLA
jgi:predicted dehydrogenase